MKNSGLISVIVPVYRVEKYLVECIESIINQTCAELQVILVDDGSPDRCGSICDRYAQLDNRIVVVHQKNAGAAAAKNAGLRIATGAYITFVDGDDFLEPDAYEKMLGAMTAYDADIVQSNFRSVYVNGSEVHNGYGDVNCFSAPQFLGCFPRDWTCALCVTKLFKRDVLKNVYFEEGHLIDDEFFTYQGVLNARKIVCIPVITYNYRQRASSVMKDPTTVERRALDHMEFLKKRMDRVVAVFPELRSVYEGDYVDSLLRLGESHGATENTVREIKKRILSFAASGKVLFWKKGQRKYALRILSFLMTGTDVILKRRNGGRGVSGYQFFE